MCTVPLDIRIWKLDIFGHSYGAYSPFGFWRFRNFRVVLCVHSLWKLQLGYWKFLLRYTVQLEVGSQKFGSLYFDIQSLRLFKFGNWKFLTFVLLYFGTFAYSPFGNWNFGNWRFRNCTFSTSPNQTNTPVWTLPEVSTVTGWDIPTVPEASNQEPEPGPEPAPD